MMPSVSVAMATFNGERHLEEQLDSIARQRVAPCELVVNDDGSTDGTVALVEAFAARSPFPVRLEVNEERLGFADNFLRAAARCEGEAVAFCDQDDVWLPERVGRAAQALAAPGIALAVHATRVVDELGRPTGAIFAPLERDQLAPPRSTDPWLLVWGMAMTFRSSLARVPSHKRPPSAHPDRALVNHDEWIYLLARATGSIAFIAEPLGLYRQHGHNLAGAPARGPLAFLREYRATQGAYYTARRDQAAGSAAVLAQLGGEYAAAVAEYEALAATLGRRVEIYDRARPRNRRLRDLRGLAADGGYRGAPERLVKDLVAALR